MREIAGKYRTEKSIFKHNGEQIPDDEPLFLFRAQDKLLPEVLEFYRDLRTKNGAGKEIQERMDQEIEKIRAWQKENYTRLPR